MRIKNKIKKDFTKIDKKVLIFILGLILLSGLVRGYNFKEWLLVRADQVRDSAIAKEVLDNGVGSLRLLGPKITTVKLDADSGRGDTLNMGPYYYYGQAFSMKIFGTPSPWTIAVPDFIFSLLAIPFFYLIVSRFFTKKISLITTTLFSFSFLIIQYSRFSWNSNQLIFWQVLLIYFLVQFAEKKSKAGHWLLGAFLALLVISQLHFLAIVGTSLVFVIFFIHQKGWRKLKWKHYLIAILMFIFFHIPLVASDIKNDRDNYKRFIAGITQQSSEKSLKENILENIDKSSRFYAYFPLPISKKEIKSIEPVRFWYLTFSLGLVLLVFRNKCKFLKSTKLEQKKILAFLILVYFGAFFLVNISVADRLEKPRYWLSIAPIAFFMVAFWLELINKINKKYLSTILLVIVVGLLFFENGYSIYYWYSSLEEGVKREMLFKKPILRPHRDLVTLGQIERASKYMGLKAVKSGKNVCYFSSEYQIKNAFKYIMRYEYPEILIKRLDSKNESSQDCVMFLIVKSDQKIEEIKEDLADRFNYKKIYRDGAIVLWQLQVKAGHDFPAQGEAIFQSRKEKTKATLWREVFGK